MIIGWFHQGSGLGNQLARLVATRVRATDLGVDWAMMYNPDGSGKKSGFKGESFMNIGQWNKGIKKSVEYFSINPSQNPTAIPISDEPQSYCGNFIEKCIRDEFGNDIRSYDPEFNFIEDNTIIEGEFQDERYWEHREKEVNEWLKVEPLDVPNDLCVIGFRGGEFAAYPDLFLPKEYYDEAIEIMKEINPDIKFQVHTDDEVLAKQCFPEYEVIHDIGINWRSMRFARYAIIANSSFFILSRWLRNGVTISPRFWGRHNTKVWSLPSNFYRRFLYI
mgnify:CR=1 FL=1